MPAGGRGGAAGGASAEWRVRLPLPLPTPPITLDRGRGAPQEAVGRAAGGARGRRDLAGVSGLGCGEGGATSLVALSGLERRLGNWRGGRARPDAGRGGGTQIEGEILPAPEGVLRLFSAAAGALPLSYTAGTSVAGGWRGRKQPPRLARVPHPRLGPRRVPGLAAPR